MGPSKAALIRDRITSTKARSTEAPKLFADQLQSYFETAMKKYKEIGRWFIRALVDRRYVPLPHMLIFPDVRIESLKESHHSRSLNYNSHYLGEEDLRRPLMAAAETMPKWRNYDAEDTSIADQRSKGA